MTGKMEQHGTSDDATADDYDLCMRFHRFFPDISELGEKVMRKDSARLPCRAPTPRNSRLALPDRFLALGHIGLERFAHGDVHHRLDIILQRLLPQPRRARGR